MEPLISVIIPVYNVESFLEKCIDSVINQSYKNLQIILIDDGSTDHSGDICDRYKNIDKRILVIHQKNQGLSVARNTGLNYSKGDWIAFLDSDDWLESDAYEVLYDIADKHQADISSCLSRNCYYGAEKPVASDSCNIFEYNDINSIVREIRKKERLRVEVWNKLWKRELLEGIRFIPGQVSEDIHFDRIAFIRAKKIVHIDRTLHNYLVGRPGSTNSSFKVARFCVFDEYDEFINDLELRGCQEAAQMIRSMAIRYLLNMYIESVDKKQTTEIKKRIIDIFNVYYKQLLCSNYLEKAFRIFAISPCLYYFISKLKAKITR